MRWRTPRRTFHWPGRAGVMGVLNVTPDSFSDGGRLSTAERAVEAALAMVEAGADIIDIGGESSRPGAEPVAEAEELRRVMPVIEALRSQTDAVLSIDTVKPGVAAAAMAAGADVINDISALGHPEMAAVAAKTGAGLVLMHMRGTPTTMQQGDLSSVDIVAEAISDLRPRMDVAQKAGVDFEAICLDPGVGFGKTVTQNLELVVHLRAWAELNRPVLLGVSRKSFLGAITGQPVGSRLMATAAACAVGLWQGAHLIRVHDVPELVDVVKVVEALAEVSSVAASGEGR